MKVSINGQKLIQNFESCELKAYPDPKTGGAPWTIGWGHTGPEVVKGLVWTQQKCDEVFAADLAPREKAVNDAVRVELTQGQFDAVVSIVFNVGVGSYKRDGIIRLKNGSPSTLLRKLNLCDFIATAAEFGKWISAGSAVENGLRRRRKAEVALFQGKDWRNV